MKFGLFVGLSCAIALPACVTPPAAVAQDTAFARGCWVAQFAPRGRGPATLRLLPEGQNYAGELLNVFELDPSTRIKVTIARDGSRASADVNGARLDLPIDAAASTPLDDATKFMMFRDGPADSHPSITFTGNGDQLILGILDGDASIIFHGERDGCD